MNVLLTGVTGYVGGRLLPRLVEEGHRVRCLARRPAFVPRELQSLGEVVEGDVLDPASLTECMKDIDTAVYLVHAMGSSGSFEAEDRIAAANFARAAADAGVKKIVYLGGLGTSSDGLSAHLRSRQEVGDVLRESGVPVLEFRASIVIGSGSLSFEMIRALVERLPVMITPRWVSAQTQPIAITDLIQYLSAGIVRPMTSHETFEIGGRDVLSYGDLMKEYARARGLRRLMIPVPVLTPRLSSLWLGLVTPLYARVGRKLIDSLRHHTVVQNTTTEFGITPLSCAEAISLALRNEDRESAASHWHGAMSAAGRPRRWGGVRFGTRLVDARQRHVAVSPGRAFQPVQAIGGDRGWYYGDWLWEVRGALDLLVGGVGMRRRRRHPLRLADGDIVDCWRVEEIIPGQRLRLVAEMKLPGRAWLQFDVEPAAEGSTITQTAIFDPVGLAGLSYWYLVSPLHNLVFNGMLKGIGRAAEQTTRRS